MKRLDRYIGLHVLTGTLLALVVLVALLAFVSFVDDIKAVLFYDSQFYDTYF